MKRIIVFAFFAAFAGFLADIALAQAIFPQYADGRAGDGSFYRSTVIVQNGEDMHQACTLRLWGLPSQTFTGATGEILTTDAENSIRFTVPSFGAKIFRSSAAGLLSSGYAEVTCNGFEWSAFLLYSFYDSQGNKLSKATVFSSPSEALANASAPMLAVDYREGSRLGIAIANNEGTRVGQYNVIVRDTMGTLLGASVITLQPRTQIAQFLDLMVTLPPGFAGTGKVVVSPRAGFGGPSAYVIGLRFTGNIFTTIPASKCVQGSMCDSR